MGGWGRSVKVDGFEITRVNLLGVVVQKKKHLTDINYIELLSAFVWPQLLIRSNQH